MTVCVCMCATFFFIEGLMDWFICTSVRMTAFEKSRTRSSRRVHICIILLNSFNERF